MIITAICNSFKREILNGVHREEHVYRIALFTEAASLDQYTDSYLGLSNEVADGSGYETGGKALTGRVISMDGDSAVVDFDDVEWSGATFSAAGALVYNDSLTLKNAVGVYSFGQNASVNGASFTVEIPLPTQTTAIVRIV